MNETAIRKIVDHILLNALNKMDENGKYDGYSLMLTYYDKKRKIDHAVIVEGYTEFDGKKEFWYYDPTNGVWGSKTVEEVTHLYRIGK